MRKYLFIFLTLAIILTPPVKHTAFASDIKTENISSIQLNSLAVDNNTGFNHLKFTVKAKKAGNFEPIIDIKKATQKSLEYFFIGLITHDEMFWVNLNPDEPSRIIDSILRNTDLGRIMINADLRLKEDTCELMNPQTSQIGKEFWSRLYEKASQLGAADRILVMTQLWIIPDEEVVEERENQLSIVKSKLKVCFEPAYLSQDIKVNPVRNFSRQDNSISISNRVKDRKQKMLQDYASGLIHELIIPHLNKRVNQAYSYADLREVYQALVLARWYKQKFTYQRNSLLQTVDLNILKDTNIDFLYSPDQIYQDYIKSLNARTTPHYFSGGIDFRNIKMTQTQVQNQAQDQTYHTPTQTQTQRQPQPQISTPNQIQTQADEESRYFTCDLYIPHEAERPLQYAKNQLELTLSNFLSSTDLIQHQRSPVVLVSHLPAITPLKFAEQRIRNLDSAGRVDRVVLSKL